MKSRTTFCILYVLFFLCLLFRYPLALADDTCAFMVTADDVPPNIVFLLDNGAAMEQIVWHNSYDNSQNFTPNISDQYDVVEHGTLKGNGFFKDNGYAVIRKDIENNGIEKYYLVAIPDNLNVADYTLKLTADGDGLSPKWTINSRTITLPAHPGNHEFEGVIDKATYYRYSSNYLNWIYFGDYSDNGGDLPSITRFYQAKKALMTVGKLIANQAKIAIYNFTATTSGASNVQPLGMVALEPLAPQPKDNTLDPNYINNINNMGTVIYSPLAEGLAKVGGFFGNPSSHIVESYCHENFIIILSPGKSSEDLSVAAKSSPSSLLDFDNDDGAEGIGEGYVKENENIHMIPIGQNGSTYLDDVAYYLYNNDIVDYQDGFQNIRTYTIGFMGDFLSNLFLINTSNNGNGSTNLYDTVHEEYGKYHFEANDPNDLAGTLLLAVKDIISQTSSFTAPVVPVTRTTSGNRIYMAFFKPNEGNFWEGNVTKFGIADDNTIVDIIGGTATWPNGAIREDAQPYWQIKDWADPNKSNYIHNSSRNIFTYLGYNTNLTDTVDLSNQFSTSNLKITAEILRWPTHGVSDIINFVRGADVLDEDDDGDTIENRAIITGDVLHSEPLVVRYNYTDYTSKTFVYFGTNDGMLHAVKDVEDPNVDVDGDETNYGTEEWAFIPPDQLPRLKDMVEGNGHQYYIDSSPKAYFKDINKNGILDDVDNDGVMDSNDDQIILICGERRGGSSYFALDVTVPDKPKYMWRIGSGNENTIIKYDGFTLAFGVNNWVGDLTTAMYNDWMSGDMTTAPFVWGQIVSSVAIDAQTGILELDNIRRHAGGTFQNTEVLTLWDAAGDWDDAAFVVGDELVPDVIIPELGESWSEPQFGLVKTTDSDTDGTAVFFIGGGYSESNSSGRMVLAVNVFTGEVVRKFTDVTTYTTDYEHTTDANMYYSVPSTVKVIDEDGNGFVDKLYVGDLGGQMWRIGQFETDASDDPLAFPQSNENINSWTAQIVFRAPTYVIDTVTHTRKFYYPPSVTLEVGYDLIVTGTGDRPGSCALTTQDRIYVIKDDHSSNTILETDLVDVTNPADPKPDLDNSDSDVNWDNNIDMGWYIQLNPGEKSLAENTVFYRTIYYTTFTPNNDPCLPGGMGKIYALNYKTGAAVIDFDGGGTLDRSTEIGGGIPSKVVTVMTDTGGTKLFISVGSTNPDLLSESFEAGVVTVDPLVPPIDFHYMWWRELLDI